MVVKLSLFCAGVAGQLREVAADGGVQHQHQLGRAPPLHWNIDAAAFLSTPGVLAGELFKEAFKGTGTPDYI